MSTLNRHILSEIFKVFSLTLFSMTLLMLIVGVTKQALDEHLGPAHILKLLPFILPDALRFTLPGTALFAVCSVYGRLSSSNEITAIKSMGVNPLVVLWPTLFASVLLSLITVVMNDVAVSWGRNGAQKVIIEGIEEIAYGMLRQRKSYNRDPRYSITVKAVEGRRLIMPTVVFQGSGNTPSITVTAEEAELSSTPGSNMLTFIIHNGSAAAGGMRYVFDYEKRQVPLDSNQGSLMPSRMPLRDIPGGIVKQREELRDFEQEQASTMAYDMLTGQLQLTASPQHNAHVVAVRQGMQQNLHRLETEPYRRWANGFACLCFVLVGSPLAIQRRDAHFLTTFFLCFMPILLVYYPMYAVTVNMAKEGQAPAECVWLGNVILMLWGAWLMRRVVRY